MVYDGFCCVTPQLDFAFFHALSQRRCHLLRALRRCASTIVSTP